MKEKGIYKLDFNSDKVIMDGYEFVPVTEYKGIFKALDVCYINAGEWGRDERNRNLVAFTVRYAHKDKQKVLYLARYDCEDRFKFAKEFDCSGYADTYDEIRGVGFLPCLKCDGLGIGFCRGGVLL